MKRIYITLSFLFLMTFSYAQDHGIVGKWKTIDDSNGKPLSIVEIFESKGKVYGKVIEIFSQKNQKKCVNCTGEDKNKPILGLIVIKGLTKDGDDYTGKILDPKQGKLYKCIVNLEGRDRLKVRGYIGISLIGRTQIWERTK